MQKVLFYSFLVINSLNVVACNSNSANQNKNEGYKQVTLSQEFKDYWYAGKAEISKFSLEQARYGQLHKGEAILIFVTEDFFVDKQVKYEHGEKENTTNVLKLNRIDRFTTGIYDYSIMTSVFTPVFRNKYPHTLKLAISAQDWCGQAYMQMNNRDGKYHWRGFSYFQDEVHEDYKTDTTWLEDEVWTRIRLKPGSLPEGEIQMVPGMKYRRLRHRKLEPEKAVVKHQAYKGNEFSGKNLMAYQIRYPELERTLTIVYEKSFPHLIQGWIDQHKSGFGDGAKMLKTIAHRKETIRTDYWNKHDVSDTTLRNKLDVGY